MKSQHKIYCLILVIIFFFLIMMGVWAIDIGVTGTENDLSITNGWWTRDPCQQYHIGLLLVIIGTLLLVILSMCLIVVSPEKKEVKK